MLILRYGVHPTKTLQIFVQSFQNWNWTGIGWFQDHIGTDEVVALVVDFRFLVFIVDVDAVIISVKSSSYSYLKY